MSDAEKCIMDALQDITEFVVTAKGTLDLLRSAWELLPTLHKHRNEVRQKLEKAENSLKESEAAAAKALGYKLCRCTFPPQIMLWKKAEGVNVCPECGNQAWDGIHISDEAIEAFRR